jgi:hypothetical protein
MDTQQVKSRQRVAEHGEVFTAEREVNAMLDLVKNETERIDSRFLEPACGDGNFLAEILRRKLAVVTKKYGGPRKRASFELWSIIALMSIYGVELLPDNTAACRERLFNIWNAAYTEDCKKEASDACRNVARFILERNILCGDALSLKDSSGNPIVFSEWGVGLEGTVKRTDYTLAELLEPKPQESLEEYLKEKKPKPKQEPGQLSLFDAAEANDDKAEGSKVAQFRPIHYLKLKEQQEAK